MSSLRAEVFFCSIDIGELQFLIKKKSSFFSFSFLSSKPWIRIRIHLKCWIRIRIHSSDKQSDEFFVLVCAAGHAPLHGVRGRGTIRGPAGVLQKETGRVQGLY
jgi:hypothetical protein